MTAFLFSNKVIQGTESDKKNLTAADLDGVSLGYQFSFDFFPLVALNDNGACINRTPNTTFCFQFFRQYFEITVV